MIENVKNFAKFFKTKQAPSEADTPLNSERLSVSRDQSEESVGADRRSTDSGGAAKTRPFGLDHAVATCFVTALYAFFRTSSKQSIIGHRVDNTG